MYLKEILSEENHYNTNITFQNCQAEYFKYIKIFLPPSLWGGGGRREKACSLNTFQNQQNPISNRKVQWENVHPAMIHDSPTHYVTLGKSLALESDAE